jgi:adenosylmethionine-8-amino-7-oxononanoate aminotransferase
LDPIGPGRLIVTDPYTDLLGAHTLKAWDKAHVWHPFTPMTPYIEGNPPLIARAEGFRLQDVYGNWYLDGSSSIWLNVHGHRVPDLDQAVRDQLDQVAHSTLLGQGNTTSTVLARRLVEITPPGLERVFFSDSGATAVEIALKAAIQWFANAGETRHKILGFTNNYHGDTMGAMSVAPDPVFHWPFLEMLQDQPRLPYPYWYHHPDGLSTPEEAAAVTLDCIDQLFASEGRGIAAAIIEPVEGAGGIVPAPVGFLKSLSELCRRYGILLIVDEVATGFGKTGTMFACEAEGVTPDLMTLGKGLTGGYLPVAATLATERVFERFLGERRNTLFHGHSFTGNQLGCAVALASLQRMPAVMEALPPSIERLWQRAAAWRGLPLVGDVRGRGMMLGVELVSDPHERTTIPAEKLAGHRVTDRARELGLLVRPIGNTVIFMPPVGVPLDTLDEMIDRLDQAFREVLPALAEELS